MAVIPRAAILIGSPSVGKALPRRNWTLSDTIDSVHVHGLVLPDSVPVDTGAIAGQIVVNGNSDILLQRSAADYCVH